MKIRTRLFLIVAVMGLVVSLLGGLAVYATLSFSDRMLQLEAAATRAYNGEHLNRLVTAVVMDARGIYAAKDTEAAAPFGEGILKSLDKIDAHLAAWRPLVTPDGFEAFEKVVARSAEFREFRAETARLGTIDPRQANDQGNNEANRANRKAYQAEIDALVEQDQANFVAIEDELHAFQGLIVPAMIGATLLGLLAGVGAALYVGTRYVSRPLTHVTDTMARIAEGDFTTEVPYAGEKNEIGQMAAAVQVFKENGIRVAEMNEDERTRHQKAADRATMMQGFQDEFDAVVAATLRGDLSKRIDAEFTDGDIRRIASNFNGLMDTVASGLSQAGDVLSALAHADLTRRMEGAYQGEFARLKDSTNTVAEKLTEIVGQLQKTSFDLKNATGEILAGANDLSERTTKQAATIEETSAAMEQLATTVLANAQRAAGASDNAGQVTNAAEEGGAVMLKANDAMGRISDSSAKISNIIGLIDDIAFQTNLLALNASVEAARAGEAGKGFAVVAVEVRRLAQSAAEASREVKALIEQSGTEVQAGSKLVADAAGKLEAMLVAVRGNRELLEGIARDSREQASAIEEVNTAVRQMDEMTQHNAALVEEINAAIEQTETQASELDRIVAVFTLDGRDEAVAPARELPPRREGAVSRQKVQAAARTYLSSGNAAIKSDEWSEF
ncbi:methyl-accepting chemotaxis protein [Devosia sp. ZB163]|uniref:methyl-accepting chemotaxis protein n=1 Tax=Devosia sp. ZB163 TaxID=3025938 RepID=UPI00235DF440|nr:methyl-accepting chemotaxis protein [Devosia sp. ZB163]MDC9822122.1 methyl-accepting chemotaxis protein [Devosia sp. ZB163]